jgi:hypothetical protein
MGETHKKKGRIRMKKGVRIKMSWIPRRRRKKRQRRYKIVLTMKRPITPMETSVRQVACVMHTAFE